MILIDLSNVEKVFQVIITLKSWRASSQFSMLSGNLCVHNIGIDFRRADCWSQRSSRRRSCSCCAHVFLEHSELWMFLWLWIPVLPAPTQQLTIKIPFIVEVTGLLSLVLGLKGQAPIAGILLGEKTFGQFELHLVYTMVGFHRPIAQMLGQIV